jgi:hypothetical protein
MSRTRSLNDTCVHVSYSSLENPSRIEKESESQIRGELVKKVFMLGTAGHHSRRNEAKGPRIELILFRSIKSSSFGKTISALGKWPRLFIGAYSYFEYCFSVFLFLLKERPKYLTCHQLLLLPLCSACKLFIGSRLIYGPHELETHRTGLIGPLLWLSKAIEAWCIRFVDSTIVVCDPIARWYEDRYSIPKVHVVPNVPYHPCRGALVPKTDLFRKHFGIPDGHLIFLYQGLVCRGRGIEQLMEVFSNVRSDRHLVIMGFGELADSVRDVCRQHPQIHYKEGVYIGEILSWTSSADVGITFVASKMTLSYQYSLSNKFFEYAIGGLFLIVSNNLVEQSRFIQQYDLGVSIEPSLNRLIDLVNHLTKSEIVDVVEMSAEFRKTISWQSFEDVYLEAYQEKGAKAHRG